MYGRAGRLTAKNCGFLPGQNPKGTVYITEGNGAVPGTPAATTYDGSCTGVTQPPPAGKCKTKKLPSEWGRVHGTGGAYGIFTTSNSTDMKYEHVANNGNGGKGAVEEVWEITEATHAQV